MRIISCQPALVKSVPALIKNVAGRKALCISPMKGSFSFVGETNVLFNALICHSSVVDCMASISLDSSLCMESDIKNSFLTPSFESEV